MANVQIGLGNIVEQPIERGWERKAGYFTVRRWQGTQSQCESQRDDLIADGGYSSVTLRELEGGVWSVDARLDSDVDGSGNPDPDASVVDTWELTANRVEKDVLASDLAAVTALADSDIKLLRDYADGRKSYEDDAWSGTGGGNAETIYGLLKRGLKSIAVFAPVLRKTQSVSNGYVLAASITNVGRVYTTASLQGSESIPASIANNMPSDTPPSGFAYGWLKGYPSITDAIGGKVELRQEWEYGLWSTVLYGATV